MAERVLPEAPSRCTGDAGTHPRPEKPQPWEGAAGAGTDTGSPDAATQQTNTEAGRAVGLGGRKRGRRDQRTELWRGMKQLCEETVILPPQGPGLNNSQKLLKKRIC